MKKVILVVVLCSFIAVVSSCTGKRCKCTTIRRGYPNAVAFEPKGTHANCSELDDEWFTSDSSALLKRTCVDE